MPDLPIYPERRESPGYALERRLDRLSSRDDNAEAAYEEALGQLRQEAARQGLALTGAAGQDALLAAQLEALATIENTASPNTEPSLTLIREIHRIANPPSDGSYRTGDARRQFRNARPSDARFVESKLKNLLDWLGAESGREMFPAERMALWFARFVEIAPFERGNFRTAHLGLSFFARAAGYPPVSLEAEHAEAIREDIERAIVFDTAPLVARFTDALSRALAHCEEAIEGYE